jgi:hypothetical protein
MQCNAIETKTDRNGNRCNEIKGMKTWNQRDLVIWNNEDEEIESYNNDNDNNESEIGNRRSKNSSINEIRAMNSNKIEELLGLDGRRVTHWCE